MRGNFWWEGWKVTEWARTGRLGWGGRGRLWDNWDVNKRGGECRRMWDGRNAAIKSDAIKLEHGGKLGCEENSRGSCYRRLNVCPGITAHELATSALCFLIWSCPPSAMAFVLALMGGHRDSHWFHCRTESVQWCAKLYAASVDDGKVGPMALLQAAWNLVGQSYSSPDIITLC